MSDTKFTPGPWEVGDCDGATIWANAGTFAFAIGFATSDANGDREMALANARLIAAAPELYEALWDLVEGPFPTSDADVERVHAKARAALIKASSEQSQ